MGAHSDPRRTLAGYLAVAAGIAVLFGAAALAALRPSDGLAWIRVPQLGADFGLDPGLKTRPLRSAVVAEALRDRLDGSTGPDASLVIPPILALNPPLSPLPAPSPAPPPRTIPTPTPAPAPSPTPSPSATPSASPCNRGNGVGNGNGNCKP